MNTEAPAGETLGPAPQESSDLVPGCHACHLDWWRGGVRQAHSGPSLGGWPSGHFQNFYTFGMWGHR